MLRTFHKSRALSTRSELSSYFFAIMKWIHTLWQDFGLKGREQRMIQAWTSYEATVLCWDDDGQGVFYSFGVSRPAFPSPASRRGGKVHRDQTAAERAPRQGDAAIGVHAGVQWTDLLQKTAAAGQTHHKISGFHRRWGTILQTSSLICCQIFDFDYELERKHNHVADVRLL